MSHNQPALDPYRTPSLPDEVYTRRPLAGRPGILTAVCVVCIVLGALGLMNSVFGTLGAIVGPKMQAKMFQPQKSKGMPKEMEDVMKNFQEEATAVQTKYYVPNVAAILFRYVAAGLLLAGGLRSLSLIEDGRKLLLIGFMVALVFELAHAILQSMQIMELMASITGFLEGLFGSMPDREKMPERTMKMMQSFVKAMIIFQFVIIYLLVLAKAALYIFGLVYFQKPHIKALFKPA